MNNNPEAILERETNRQLFLKQSIMDNSIDKLDVKQMMQVKGGASADDVTCRDGAIGVVNCSGTPALPSQQDVTP